MALLDHRITATTKKLAFKNSHLTSVGATYRRWFRSFFKEAASKYHQFYLQNKPTPILSTPLRFLVLYGASCFSSRV
jgi:hypothetical protein